MTGCATIIITPLVQNSVPQSALPVPCGRDGTPRGTTLAEAGLVDSTGAAILLNRNPKVNGNGAKLRHNVGTISRLRKRSASIICLAALMAAAGFAPASKSAQTPQANAAAAPAKSDAAIDNAAKKGIPLTVTSNVSDQASLQAVLVPASLARKIFGKEIAENCAVVEVIISNHDSKSTLVIHDVFLDYSRWLLSGISTASRTPLTGLDATQAANNTSQVASIESRLVRGELLDAQQWTARNWTMRTLAFVSAVAVGFEFPFSPDVTKGIGAFNGTVVPGASTLWPDGTVNQINRISDFGFQTNKAISKQSSDVVVAFFPIDRFLTSGFRKVFLTDPAGWFVPYELLADPKTEPQFEKFVRPLTDGLLADRKTDDSSANDHTGTSGGKTKNKAAAGDAFQAQMLKSMLVKCSPASASDTNQTPTGTASTTGGADSAVQPEDPSCTIQKIINGVSLNNIHVVIEGVMTVDVAAIPATIYSVDFKDGNVPSIWTDKGTKQSGSITGLYLTGGVPAVVDASGKTITGVTFTVDTDTSTDTELDFTMTLDSCIAPGNTVFLVVNKSQGTTATGASAKPASGGKKPDNSVASTPFELPQQPVTPCPATDDGKGAAAAPAPAKKPADAPATPPAASQVKGA
jgi:hypothetical protein